MKAILQLLHYHVLSIHRVENHIYRNRSATLVSDLPKDSLLNLGMGQQSWKIDINFMKICILAAGDRGW